MSEHLLDDLRMNTLAVRQRRGCVAKVVENGCEADRSSSGAARRPTCLSNAELIGRIAVWNLSKHDEATGRTLSVGRALALAEHPGGNFG